MIRPAVLFTVPQNARSKGRGGTRAIHSKGRVAIILSLGIGLQDVTSLLTGSQSTKSIADPYILVGNEWGSLRILLFGHCQEAEL